MFDWFKKSPPPPPPPEVPAPAPEVVSEPAPPPAPAVILLPPRMMPLTPKKWVTDGTRVGIVSHCDTSGYVVVDYVNELGITVACQRAHPGNLKLCRREQIPAPRRPSVEQGILLGYL